MGSEVEQTTNTKNTHNDNNEHDTTDSSTEFQNSTTASNENHANGNIAVSTTLSIVQPHSLLPKPVPPRAISNNHQNDVVPSSSFGIRFLRQRSNDLSSAISRGISSLKEINKKENDDDVTELDLSGLKVVVMVKNDASFVVTNKGVRISFFSRSNCRDCSAVRRFFRERGLRFVEINVDVYTEREKELRDRTGNATVPKIFFNGELIGGLVELNTMRKNGGEELEKRLTETVTGKFSGDAPVPPAYGFDDVPEGKEEDEEVVKVVRLLRQRLPIQERLMKMKIVRNCFSGSELVELLVRHHGYAPNKVRYD